MGLTQISSAEPAIHVERTDLPGDVCITIRDPLDDARGRSLLEAAGTAAVTGGTRITVDLRQITSFTEGGVKAATACCRLAAGLPRGVNFVASGDSSRQVLLAILRQE